jgi:hypothetical protein
MMSEVKVGFSKVFDAAVEAALDSSKKGRFEFLSEKDIQALVFHYAIIFAGQEGLQLKVHAEPTKNTARSDLVLGDDEIFVEIKFSKEGRSGGFTQALKNWHDDIDKLRQYKTTFPTARCVFLAVDEGPYLSNPSSDNFFNPAKENLKGEWRQLRGGQPLPYS